MDPILCIYFHMHIHRSYPYSCAEKITLDHILKDYTFLKDLFIYLFIYFGEGGAEGGRERIPSRPPAEHGA